MTVIINRFHKRAREVEYPAIFGSSTRRVDLCHNEVPGPGSYNVVPKRKKIRFIKKSLATIPFQVVPEQPVDKLLFGLAVTAESEQSELFQIKNGQK
jgi:hypothetical protein